MLVSLSRPHAARCATPQCCCTVQNLAVQCKAAQCVAAVAHWPLEPDGGPPHRLPFSQKAWTRRPPLASRMALACKNDGANACGAWRVRGGRCQATGNRSFSSGGSAFLRPTEQAPPGACAARCMPWTCRYCTLTHDSTSYARFGFCPNGCAHLGWLHVLLDAQLPRLMVHADDVLVTSRRYGSGGCYVGRLLRLVLECMLSRNARISLAPPAPRVSLDAAEAWGGGLLLLRLPPPPPPPPGRGAWC